MHCATLACLASVFNVFGDRQGVLVPLARPSVWRTWHSAPLDVALRQERAFAKGYDVRWFTDEECERFVQRNAGDFALQAYRKWPSGANRADLWRYLKLYVDGGIYLDADLVLLAPLEDVFTRPDYCYSVVDAQGDRLFQAVLACPARHPAMLQMFMDMLLRPPLAEINKTDATSWAADVVRGFGVPWRPGVHHAQRWTLFSESCVAGNDKYGLACTVRNVAGRVIFRSR